MCVASVAGGATVRGVVISEVHYNPLPLTDAEMARGLDDDSDFEYVELFNPGPSMVSISGWEVDGAVKFTFDFGSTIAPGEYLVIAKDDKNLSQRHPGLKISGDYSGKLANEGETLRLRRADGSVVEQVVYGFSSPWPEFANARGGSLVRIDPASPAPAHLATSWRASRTIHGTPGAPSRLTPGPMVINEVLAHTDVPLEDAIELKNISGSPVNISGWYLTDSLDDIRKYMVPVSDAVAPDGYRTFYQREFEVFNARTPFSFNSFKGDSLYVFEFDASGNPIRMTDDYSFPASENGISFGRIPDGTGEFTRLENPTFGTEVNRHDSPLAIHLFRKGTGKANRSPLIGPVVIDAVQFHPEPGQPEFIRLKNISPRFVSLWDPEHPSNTWGVDGAIRFTFPMGTTLAPGEEIFLSGSAVAGFRNAYSVQDKYQVFGPWTGILNNDSAYLRLFKPDPPQTRPPDVGFVPKIAVDDFTYRVTGPWPENTGGTNRFLTRIKTYGIALYPESWTTSTQVSQPVSQSIPQLNIQLMEEDRVEVFYSIESDGIFELESSPDLRKWFSIEQVNGPIEDSITHFFAQAEMPVNFFRIRELQ